MNVGSKKFASGLSIIYSMINKEIEESVFEKSFAVGLYEIFKVL